MTRSGIDPLDEHLGGLAAGRIHLLGGEVGTGKTSACLHFVAAGMQAGERSVILTQEEPAELGAHAAFLGIDLAGPLRRGRLAALRFHPGFARRFATSGSYTRVVEDLRRMMGTDAPPTRIVVDPLSPFLWDGSPAGPGIAALVEFLESLGATVLLTCGHPLTPGVDRRLDPLIDRASTIISLEHDPEGGHRMHVSRARLVGAPRIPLPFRIGPSGIPDGGNGRATGAGTRVQLRPLSGRGRLAVIRAGNADLPEDMLAQLRRDYDVTIAESLDSDSAADGAADAAGVIIAADRKSLASAHDLVRQLAELPRRPPISVILGGHHRSLDRARLLRTGAEDVFAWDLGGQELLQRLAKALARGADAAMGAPSGPQFGDPLDLKAFVRPEFRAALTQALATRPPLEHPTTWVAMALTPRPRTAEGAVGRSALVEMLEGVVLTAIRTADGDRAAAADDSVVLYLHEAGVGDAETVAARIRRLWRAGRHGPLRVQLRPHTSDETAPVSAVPTARLS